MNHKYYDDVWINTVNNPVLMQQHETRLSHLLSYIEGEDWKVKFDVLDIGCGMGILENLLDDVDYVGIDYAPLTLNYAAHQRRHRNSVYVNADILSPIVRALFGNECADIAVFSEVLEHFEYPEDVLDIFAGSANRYIITVPVDMPNEPSHVKGVWTEGDVRELVRGLGEIVELHKFGLNEGDETWWLCVVDR